jgi:hypothetical protein
MLLVEVGILNASRLSDCWLFFHWAAITALSSLPLLSDGWPFLRWATMTVFVQSSPSHHNVQNNLGVLQDLAELK